MRDLSSVATVGEVRRQALLPGRQDRRVGLALGAEHAVRRARRGPRELRRVVGDGAAGRRRRARRPRRRARTTSTAPRAGDVEDARAAALGEVDERGREVAGPRRASRPGRSTTRTSSRSAPRRSIVSTKFVPPAPNSQAVRTIAWSPPAAATALLAGELRAPVGRQRRRSGRTRRTARAWRRRRRSRSRRGRRARRRPRPRRATCPAPSPLTRVAPASSASAPSTSVHAAQLTTASGAAAATTARDGGGVGRRRARRASRATTSWPRRARRRRRPWPSIPPAPVTSSASSSLEDPDLGVVADHEAVGARLAVAAADASRCARAARTPCGRRGRAPSEPASRIECSTSARSIDAALADRRVRARCSSR